MLSYASTVMKTFTPKMLSILACIPNHALIPDHPTTRAMVSPSLSPSPSITELALTLTAIRTARVPSLQSKVPHHLVNNLRKCSL